MRADKVIKRRVRCDAWAGDEHRHPNIMVVNAPGNVSLVSLAANLDVQATGKGGGAPLPNSEPQVVEVKAVVTTEEYVGGVHRADVVQSLHDCPDKLIHGAVRRTM